MAHASRPEVEPIPFVAADRTLTQPVYGYGTQAATAKAHGHAPGSGVSDERRAASVTSWETPIEYAFGDDMFDPLPGSYDASTSPNTDLAAVTNVPVSKAMTIGLDSFDTPLPLPEKSQVKKRRAPRAKSTKGRVGPLAADPLSVLDALLDETSQATRKSEIEKKSRMKRASNMDTMKLQVTQLEQSLLRLAQKHQQAHDADAFNQDTHLRLPLHTRLVKMRELLAHQFQESVKLRNEQFQLYQRLQHFVDINESLRNVVSAHTFTDATVFDLLSWWTPPTDEQCHQLAAESMEKIHAFTFSKRKATDEHAGWKLAYDLSPEEGCKFMITRNVSMMDVPAVAQTIWDARYTSQAANLLAGGMCKVDISVLKAVNKDMVVVNRSMRFPDFAVHTLYLMFRTEVDGVFYIVSRELGRSQNMTWDRSTHDFPESSADKWVEVFTWSKFTKVADDPSAAMCTGKCAQTRKDRKETYKMEYGGWWGTTYALGIRRWLMEMLFMVVRWEALHVQPLLPTGAWVPESEPIEDA